MLETGYSAYLADELLHSRSGRRTPRSLAHALRGVAAESTANAQEEELIAHQTLKLHRKSEVDGMSHRTSRHEHKSVNCLHFTLKAHICMDAAADGFPLSWEPSHRPAVGGSAANDTAGSGGGSSSPTDSVREPGASRDGAGSLSSNIFRAGIRGALREAANATLTNLDSQETAAAAAERHRHCPVQPLLTVMHLPAVIV